MARAGVDSPGGQVDQRERNARGGDRHGERALQRRDRPGCSYPGYELRAVRALEKLEGYERRGSAAVAHRS